MIRYSQFDTATGLFECESGLTLDKILEIIVPKGWFLPVTPGTKFITVGGAVGSDVHGKNHHVDGSFSNHIASHGSPAGRWHNFKLFTSLNNPTCSRRPAVEWG